MQRDFTFFDDFQRNSDYDGVWEVRTQMTDEGWTAEFRIPFSQMRFGLAPGDEVVWGFQVERVIYRRAETDLWVGSPRGEQGHVSRFGHLVFPERLSPPRRVELLPYTFVRREDLATASPEHSVQGGLDLPRRARDRGHALGDVQSRFRPGGAGSRRPEPHGL